MNGVPRIPRNWWRGILIWIVVLLLLGQGLPTLYGWATDGVATLIALVLFVFMEGDVAS